MPVASQPDRNIGSAYRISCSVNWGVSGHIRNQPAQPWCWNIKLKVTDTGEKRNWSRISTHWQTLSHEHMIETGEYPVVRLCHRSFSLFREGLILSVCVHNQVMQVDQTGLLSWLENSITSALMIQYNDSLHNLFPLKEGVCVCLALSLLYL